MISKEDKAKIGDFKEVFRMTVNPTNDEDINKVVDDLFKNVEYNYEEYKDVVPYVSVEQETYKYHILQPVEGKYSLLDFLLNRAISNVDSIWITNDNCYGSDKGLRVNKIRYEAYRSSFSDEFIKKQYQKGRMHETSHALHAWDVKQDNTIHSKENVDFQKRVQLFNELLGFKYSNLLKLNEIEGKSQQIFNWRRGKKTFADDYIDEIATEYFATKYSGLYMDNNNDAVVPFCKTEDINEGVWVPNHFNGYSQGSYLMYHLENLVSKQAMFNSRFFASDEAFIDFCNRYAEPMKKTFNKYKEKIQKSWDKKIYGGYVNFMKEKYRPVDSLYAFYELKYIFYIACRENPTTFSKEFQEKIALYHEVLNEIFTQSYLQEYNEGRISKEKMLEILPMAYRLSPVVVDKEKNKWVDSPIRSNYKKIFKELQKENMHTSTVTPDNISNTTAQIVQANPGEMSKRVQSVSKSFAESLKQNVHSNDDGEPSTRSGYRYAQVDTYNRKKGQGR